MVHAAQCLQIPPFAQRQLLDHCMSPGLIFVQSLNRLATTHLAITAKEIIDNLPGRPFFVLVANLREIPQRIPKHTAVSTISTDPLRIIRIPRQSPLHRADPAVLITGLTLAFRAEDGSTLTPETDGPTECEKTS